MELAQRLEVHYHLKDNSHSMNAFIRNKCEAEALAAFRHMADTLGIEVILESTAYTEGGLREVLKFINHKDNASPSLLVAFLALIVAIWNAPPKPDKELEQAQKALLLLSIQEKKLTNEKLEQELRGNAPHAKEQPATKSAPDKDASRAVTEPPQKVSLQTDFRIRTRRSNFYKALLPYDRVIGVGLGVVPETAEHSEIETYVPRSNFRDFILRTDKLPSETVPDAVIEIVAPVIREGDIQWKGVWRDDVIGFAMADKDFKEMVLRREVSFQHGNAIECVLEIEKKLDETGEPRVTGYTVSTVLAKIEGSVTTQTPQGRAKRFHDKHANDQLDLLADGGDRAETSPA